MKKTKPNYGQEMIPLLVIMALLFLLNSAIALYLFITGFSNLTVIIILGAISIITGIVVGTGLWSSRIGKLILRDKLIAELKLNGTENVLDLSCGRGLITVGIAKKLTTGKIIGLDHWKSTLEYSYTRQMAENNIDCEEVGHAAEIVDGDAMNLKFENDQFDIITSSLAVHHITDPRMAFKEMWRVLRPGGIIAIADLPISIFRKQIEETGFEIVLTKPLVRLFFIKMRLIIATKKPDIT